MVSPTSKATASTEAAPPRPHPSLVGVGDIAERLAVPRQTADNWRLRGVLPAPDWVISGRPVWEWTTIEQWADDTGRLR